MAERLHEGGAVEVHKVEAQSECRFADYLVRECWSNGMSMYSDHSKEGK